MRQKLLKATQNSNPLSSFTKDVCVHSLIHRAISLSQPSTRTKTHNYCTPFQITLLWQLVMILLFSEALNVTAKRNSDERIFQF